MAFETVARARPYALLAEHHPVAGRSTATLGELAQTPMVLLDLPELAHLKLGMLQRAGIAPPEIIRTTSLETMRGLVAGGDGLAIVNPRLRPRDGSGAPVHTVEIAGAEEVILGLFRVAGLRPNHGCRSSRRSAART
jgi:DNA-binding transcriptional LysR family regulator